MVPSYFTILLMQCDFLIFFNKSVKTTNHAPHFAGTSNGAVNKTDMSLFEPGTSLHVEGRIRSVRYVGNDGYERAIQEIVVSKAERTEASEVKP